MMDREQSNKAFKLNGDIVG
jgi:hypothetical protein